MCLSAHAGADVTTLSGKTGLLCTCAEQPVKVVPHFDGTVTSLPMKQHELLLTASCDRMTVPGSAGSDGSQGSHWQSSRTGRSVTEEEAEEQRAKGWFLGVLKSCLVKNVFCPAFSGPKG